MDIFSFQTILVRTKRFYFTNNIIVYRSWTYRLVRNTHVSYPNIISENYFVRLPLCSTALVAFTWTGVYRETWRERTNRSVGTKKEMLSHGIECSVFQCTCFKSTVAHVRFGQFFFFFFSFCSIIQC